MAKRCSSPRTEKAVRIGANCRIARDVVIMDTDQHAVDDSGVKMLPVNIEDRVWLGQRAMRDPRHGAVACRRDARLRVPRAMFIRDGRMRRAGRAALRGRP
jgi:hypothetical protein